MHEGVRFVYKLAFQGCDNLAEIKGLENAEIIKTVDGYQDCLNLQSIKLPQTVTTIGNSAFRDCKSLKLTNIQMGDSDNKCFAWQVMRAKSSKK